MEPIRVLHIIDGMGSGGAEAFIMNLYRNIDRTKVQFDFLLRSTENLYLDEIQVLGGRSFMTASFPRHAWQNYKDTEAFFAEHKEYALIHVHGNALIYMSGLILAKKAGVPCRIMHSHNTQARKPIYRLIHEGNKLFINTLATTQLACSETAGEWMFNGHNCMVVNNGIDVKEYLYNDTDRDEIRKEFQLAGKFVVGHVGRFLQSKNHAFLVAIFSEIHKRNDEAVLLLIGTGPLEEDIRKQVQQLGLEDAVIFAGVRSDVKKMLQAMDVFLFPSLFEGLGIVTVEAQAAGLHTIVSEAVPKEAFLTEMIESIPLSAQKEEWAEHVLRYQHGYERPDTFEQLRNAGYDIESVAKKMERFYISKSTEK